MLENHGDNAMTQLTMGPVLFNWQPEAWRDFYFRIADESPVDRVYVGEVICSKRHPLFQHVFPDVIERLVASGKEVVLSTLAEVMSKQDIKVVKSMTSSDDFIIEVNDVSALSYLEDKNFYVGPLFNTYNEDSVSFLARKGAKHITLPTELPASAISALGETSKKLGITLETQVFGRMSLALSARCYHARAHNLRKDTCQFVCDNDPDGMAIHTTDDKPFLAINGIQTMSYPYLNLLNETHDLQKNGITHFRLSPHTVDMVAVSNIFRQVLDKKIESNEAEILLSSLRPEATFANGFYHHKEGIRNVV